MCKFENHNIIILLKHLLKYNLLSAKPTLPQIPISLLTVETQCLYGFKTQKAARNNSLPLINLSINNICFFFDFVHTNVNTFGNFAVLFIFIKSLAIYKIIKR